MDFNQRKKYSEAISSIAEVKRAVIDFETREVPEEQRANYRKLFEKAVEKIPQRIQPSVRELNLLGMYVSIQE